MNHGVPLWVEIVVGCLLLASAVFTLVAAWGMLRLKNFYQRMHPPALVVTWSAWCVSIATMLFFSMQSRSLDLRAWSIIIILSITVPISTVLISRAALFRNRRAPDGQHLPPPLHPAYGPHPKEAGQGAATDLANQPPPTTSGPSGSGPMPERNTR